MTVLRLTKRQQEQLESQLRDTADAGVFRRTLAVLEAAQGRPIATIAQLLRTSRVSVYHWIERYRQQAARASLEDQRGGNRPSVWTEELQGLLRACLGYRPDHFGYPALNWTVGLLADHLHRCSGRSVSPSTVRRELHRLEYVWKRPRYVLDPDPEREKKTPDPPPAAEAAAAHDAPVRG
jgi:transposase